MKIALVQMQSSADLDKNLRAMERLTVSAAQRGADLVIFPEMAYFTGPSKDCPPVTERYEEWITLFASWAKTLGICLMPGSVREPTPSGKQYNTLLALGPDGQILARYRKIFLFRADLPDRKYDESQYTEPGSDTVVFDYKDTRIGLAICYDLRFPELFRCLKKKGAQLVVLPSAFTVPTGRAHWETLLCARAIENQFYLAAPGLVGRSGNGALTYGHSMIIDPWGTIRARSAGRPTLVTFRYDPKHAIDCRSRVDAWASRREDLFPIA